MEYGGGTAVLVGSVSRKVGEEVMTLNLIYRPFGRIPESMAPRQGRGTGQKIEASAKLEKKVLRLNAGIIKRKESSGMTQAE
jgi:hypothetical protein